MLDDAQKRERDALRAAVFGPPSAQPATAEDRARLDDLERKASGRLPTESIEPDADTGLAASSQRSSPAEHRAAPMPPRRAGSRWGWGSTAAAGVILAAVAFVCGMSLDRLFSPPPVVASSLDRDDPGAVRSFARVTAYVDWDEPSLLGVAKYGNDVTAWTGRIGDGALDCAAFDDGFEVAVQCLRLASNPLPHSFTWTKESDPDSGEYSVRVGRSGDVDGWFVSTPSEH